MNANSLFQYLERSNLTKTLETFLAEAVDLGLPIHDEVRNHPTSPTKHDADEKAPNTSAPMVSGIDVDHLLGMFDNVYEDAFFKTWDDAEVEIFFHIRGKFKAVQNLSKCELFLGHSSRVRHGHLREDQLSVASLLLESRTENFIL